MVAFEGPADPRRPGTAEPASTEPATATADGISPAARGGGGTARQVLSMSLLATLVLAIFAAPDLASSADGLRDGPITTPLRRLAGAWDADLAAIGLTRPHDALRAAIQRFLALSWGGGGQD